MMSSLSGLSSVFLEFVTFISSSFDYGTLLPKYAIIFRLARIQIIQWNSSFVAFVA